MNLLNKTPEETISEFKKRLYVLKLRDNLFTWDEIVQAVNDVVLPKDRRKRDAYSREAHRLLSKGLLDMDNYSISKVEENIMEDDRLTAIKKERYKLSEERIQNNANLRI